MAAVHAILRRVPARRRGRLLLTALGLLAGGGTLSARQVPVAVPPYRVVGYVTAWNPAADQDLGKLDTLIFAFATIADGRVVLDPQAAQRLRAIVALKAGHPRLEVDVSVGGWGAGGFSEAARSEAGRRRFADSAAALVAASGADGLDVDWEYPGHHESGIASSPQDREDFTLLLRATRASLDRAGARQGRRYTLSAAVADGPFVDGIDIAAADPSLDWFNLMTYDFFNGLTPVTGHHAALYAPPFAPAGARSADRAVRQFLAAGVAPRKLLLGAAFYGREFAAVKSAAHDGLYQPYGHFQGAPSWAQIERDYLGKPGYVRHWDPVAQAPYLWNAAARRLLSYEDPRSLAAKAAYVKAHGLGGIMYWEQSEDPQGELLDAVWRGLR